VVSGQKELTAEHAESAEIFMFLGVLSALCGKTLPADHWRLPFPMECVDNQAYTSPGRVASWVCKLPQ